MAVMMEKLYDALRAANIPDDKARAAAVEAAEFDRAIADIKSIVRLHTWMLSVNTAMLIALLLHAFTK
jgi:hypothetical protein